MCNLFENRTAFSQLLEAFDRARKPVLKPGREAAPNLGPLDAVRPTDAAPVLRAYGDGCELASMRWGLKPARPKAGPITNWRAEGRRFSQGRCLVPVTAFFEFTGARAPKTRWRFAPADGAWFCFAGLWRPEDGVDRFAVLTVDAGPDVAPYHPRQPVIRAERRWAAWLGEGAHDDLLTPSPVGTLQVRRDSAQEETLSLFGAWP